MAKYTLTLDSLLSMGYNIFSDDWQLLIPEHKPELCDKIIAHYRFNEIGAETPARFKHYLNTQIKENLPYYNMLYESSLFDLAPLYNQWVENGTEATAADHEIATQVAAKSNSALQRMVSSVLNTGDVDRKENTDVTRSGEKDWTENDVINRTENETTEVDDTRHSTEAEDTTKDSTTNMTGHDDEVTDDVWNKTSKVTKDQKTTGTTTGTHNQWSSDTPQGQIVNGALSIDSQYLTNYQHSSDQESSTGTLNESVDSVEDFTDKITRSFDTKRDTTAKDVTVRDLTGDVASTEDTDRNLTGKDTIDKRGHEDWGEKGNTDFTGTEGEVRRTFNDETHDSTASEAATSGIEQDKTRKQESLTVTKGNVGISRAQLVKQFREAFINVDKVIIDDLANNFMGVF